MEKRKNIDDTPPIKKTRSSSGPTFDFKCLCLFCGKSCSIIRDERHPDRWEKNPGILCRTADRKVHGQKVLGFKEVLLEVCDERNDLLGDDVRIRLQGAPSDLHAADARYHKNCYSSFVAARSIKAALNKYDNESTDKDALNYVIRSIRNDKEGVWDADFLHSRYLFKGGTDTHITRFTNRLKQFLNDEVYFFDSPGLSTVIMGHDIAVKLLKVKASKNDDDVEKDIQKVANKIKSEIDAIPSLRKDYPILNNENIESSTSKTLQALLLAISPRFRENEKVSCLISGIINTISNNRTSMLQVALGLLIEGKKNLEHLHEYGVVSTYDETRRFKISAASCGATQVRLHAEKGMIQVPGYFNIGKKKALSKARQMQLKFIGKIESEMNDVIEEGKVFVSSLYGMKDKSSSNNRSLLWKKKTDSAKLTAKPIALKFLPPTDEALKLNICRAHHQAILWDKCVFGGKVPSIDPEVAGWRMSSDSGILEPIMLPDGVSIAPEEVLRVIRCNCSTSRCRTLVCSCNKSSFPCTVFCSCECIECENPFNIDNNRDDEQEEDNIDTDELV